MKSVDILIVDDNELDRYILKRQLLDAGVRSVVEKEDGAAALAYLQGVIDQKQHAKSADDVPLIIFLDINMPHIDGFGFLKRFAAMHEDVALDSSVVMMFSSSERTEDKEAAMAYEFVHHFFIKGMTPIQQIRKHIEDTLQRENSD